MPYGSLIRSCWAGPGRSDHVRPKRWMCLILEKPHLSLRPWSAVHISLASPDLPRPPLSSAPCFASIFLSYTAELPSSSAVLGTLREMVEEGKGELQKDSGEEETGLRLPTNRHGNLSSASSDARLKDSLQTIKSSKNSVSKPKKKKKTLLFILFIHVVRF